jgi:hypothetical protein
LAGNSSCSPENSNHSNTAAAGRFPSSGRWGSANWPPARRDSTRPPSAFNNVVFAGPQSNVTSADFGRIRLLQVNTPRQIQFGLRFSY